MNIMNYINYEVTSNMHTLSGAATALRLLLESAPGVASILDVGCGPGSWIKAAGDVGIIDVVGVDGKIPERNALFCDPECIRELDLTTEWSLGRKFDLALCLEVAEHLPSEAAANLVRRLCGHSDNVFFSAAIPGQGGQHHVNCQWPDYWQHLFNKEGFSCYDDLRWKIWDSDEVEPWYRQNIFRAKRDTVLSGQEPRIPRVVHPTMHKGMVLEAVNTASVIHRVQIEAGSQQVWWYPLAWCKAMLCKIARCCS